MVRGRAWQRLNSIIACVREGWEYKSATGKRGLYLHAGLLARADTPRHLNLTPHLAVDLRISRGASLFLLPEMLAA